MKKLGRLITAMATPFNDKMEVDYAQVKKFATALLDSGSDGILASGTTGEGPTLTHEEKLRLFKTVKEAVGDRGSFIAGTGNYSTAESIAMTKEAEKIGADACLLVVPYYNKPTQEGLYQHFKAIAQSTKLPCIMYNVPPRTVTNMTAETCLRCSQIENIVGVKEASGNFDQIAKIISGARQGFLVWSGNDNDTFPLMAMGGYGIISVASMLVGKQIKEMIDLTVAGKMEKAAAIHLNLMPLVNALFIITNPIPVKFCLNEVGFKIGKPRLPLVEPDEKTAAAIRETLKKYRIDLPIDG